MTKPSKPESGKRPNKKATQTFDGATGNPDHPPRRIDLSSLKDIRLELAAVYRKMDGGEIESQDGTRRAYVLKTIHDVIVSTELERRIQDLEERQGLPGNRSLSNAAHTH